MKTFNYITMIATALFLTVAASSCQKEETAGSMTTLSATSGDIAQSQLAGDEAVSAADDYVPSNVMSAAPQKAPALVSKDSIEISVSHPDSMTVKVEIDFGNSGVIGKRGNVLKGELEVLINKRTKTRTISFVNFFVNDNQVKGSKTVEYGKNTAGQPTWTITARDTIIRKEDGAMVIWNSDRVRTRTSDNGTPLNLWDDEYSVSGTANGVNAKGKAYTMTIDSNNPLVFYANYQHIVKGSMVIASEQKSALLDYGDGTKDNKATVTVNGTIKEITLGK